MTETSNNAAAPGVRSPFSRQLVARLLHRLTPKTIFIVICICLVYKCLPKLQWLLQRIKPTSLLRFFAPR
jgi:hypothetical protein